MGKLSYAAHTSLDGYLTDALGNFDFTAPDEEVHEFVNDSLRDVGTFLFGRRMYETMSVWETWDTSAEPRVVKDFAAIWKRTDKIVYSTGLHTVGTRLSRLEREFDPTAVRALKASSPHDLEIGGATIAGEAFRCGVVDEVQLYLSPIIVGGGLRALPDGVRLDLSLEEERRFAGGVVFLRYSVGSRRD